VILKINKKNIISVLWMRICIRIRIRIILVTWIRIRIRIKLDPEPDPDMHQFADDKSKCMEYETILALFQWFEPLFGS
jgi:hypothetical protein